MELINRKIKDRKLLDVIRRIVKNNDVSRRVTSGKGLPIGNLTSQFFANVYLNRLDHFIKETLRLQHYVRYMDDLVVFSNNKAQLKETLQGMTTFLKQSLELELKSSGTLINTRMHGLSFLGMRIFPGLVRIKNENLHRIRKKIKRKEIEFQQGLITEDHLAQSLQSYAGYVCFTDSGNRMV